MNISFDRHGRPGDTVRIPVTDTVQQFAEAQYTLDGSRAMAVTITCETNNVRFTLGDVDPTQGASGLGHILYVGQSIRLTNAYALTHFNFINHTNGSAGVIQATFEFPIGV